jgi:hypothetical protein
LLVVVALLALVVRPASAQSDRLEQALATLPDGVFATHAWLADRPGQGFVYLLEIGGQPPGTLYQPYVRDLGRLARADFVRALRPLVGSDRAAAEVVVEPVRNAAGAVVAYVVRPRDVDVIPAFARDGRYTLYVRGPAEPMEMGGGGGGGGGM